MYEEMQIRNYSPRSIENYISHVSLVSSHFGKSPEHISIAEIKECFFHKVETKNLSASSENQTISAFKILFADVLGRDWDPESGEVHLLL
ncbi:MAG TPA: site-specific integrase [Lunatimonas sp.]|nr:site-specific integrase [Lunatimonas sp.]